MGKLTCEQFGVELRDYFDNDCDIEAQRELLDKHLEECPNCTKELREAAKREIDGMDSCDLLNCESALAGYVILLAGSKG